MQKLTTYITIIKFEKSLFLLLCMFFLLRHFKRLQLIATVYFKLSKLILDKPFCKNIYISPYLVDLLNIEYTNSNNNNNNNNSSSSSSSNNNN
jgi:hypothetical protein